MAIGFITKDFERKCPEFGAKWGRSVISSVTDFVKSCHNTQFATKEWVYRSLRELFVESGEETFEEIFLDVWQIFGRDGKVMFLPDKYMMLRAYNYDHSEVDGFVKQFKVLVNDFEFSMNTIPELVRKGLSTMKEPIDEEYALYTISKMLVKSENHAHTVTKFNVSLYRLESMFRQKVLFLIGEDRLEALSQIKDTLILQVEHVRVDRSLRTPAGSLPYGGADYPEKIVDGGESGGRVAEHQPLYTV